MNKTTVKKQAVTAEQRVYGVSSVKRVRPMCANFIAWLRIEHKDPEVRAKLPAAIIFDALVEVYGKEFDKFKGIADIEDYFLDKGRIDMSNEEYKAQRIAKKSKAADAAKEKRAAQDRRLAEMLGKE